MRINLIFLILIIPATLLPQETDSVKAQEDVSIRYFKVQEGGVKILSDAYTHYVEKMESPFLIQCFKSKSFDEEFECLDYNNPHRVFHFGIAPVKVKHNPAPAFRLSTYKKLGRYWYVQSSLVPQRTEYYHLFKKEWIVLDTLDRKNLKQISHDYDFSDIRLFYDPELLKFTMRLKHKFGFLDINVVPNLSYSSREISLEYANYYKSYLRMLNSRRSRFNNKLVREKKKSDNEMAKAWRSSWKLFKQNYMSEEEKQMTYEEWMAYFYAVCSNEQQSLTTAPADIKVLERSLWIEGFCASQVLTLNPDDALNIIQEVTLIDTDSSKLIPKSIMTVNKSNTSYLFQNVKYGLSAEKLLLTKGDKYLLVCELVNGDYAVSKIFSVDEKSLKPIAITCEIYPAKLVSVGQIKNMLLR
ncbi:MAG: hypothetical protein K9H64_19220 [Bacteroidales bacterium]|nr:hypothetical protein [Bacteroidales bacterium]MCF8458170.1 hypothetical protein [Bacteroidales bacterium]